nr:sugar transferase [Amylibacter sp.]
MTTHYSDIPNDTKANSIASCLPRPGLYESVFKRGFDIFIVLLALPIILPIIAVLAFLVARDGSGAFYCQKRVGRGGEIYRMWKLRTMVANADRQLKDYLAGNPAAHAEWTTTQKLKKDPRITPIGRILRKCSMDELPQLWNVLIGDMSLVGPRPMLPEQQELYPGLAYYHQRPGITGSWQVSQRNESTFADRARFDTDYSANISFTNDVRLLLATAQVVVRGTGY